MEVRIGSDIRLRLQLNFGPSADPINIQVAQVYFVNTTLKKLFIAEQKRCNRFMRKFPIISCPYEYCPDAYNIHCSGFPKYNATVCNQYNGFGVYPKWDEIPCKNLNITEYLSKAERTENPDTIIATFPAAAQLYTGKYDVTVVATIYDPGYETNGRVITVDFHNAFDLVDSNGNITGIKYLDIVDDDDPIPHDDDDIYVNAGSYNSNSIKLSRTDGNSINIDITPVSGWYEGD